MLAVGVPLRTIDRDEPLSCAPALMPGEADVAKLAVMSPE